MVIIFVFFFLACGNTESEKRLQLKEQALERKEQQLLSLEQQLKSRELELVRREQNLDSLTNPGDTLGVYNSKLIGLWSVTMECTETTCEGSAIGDRKTEQWNISYHGNHVVARATAEKRLVRIYRGFYKEGVLQLSALQAPHPETRMDVTLNPNPDNPNVMEGQRIINQAAKCRIVYQLKAERL